MLHRSRHARSATAVARLIAGLLLSTAVCAPARAEPVVQELPGSGAAERLSDALRVLATNDGDVLALTAAGNAALDLNDENAAFGFFARAAAVAPRDPEAKVGLARVLVRLERADEALVRFREAVALGADPRRFVLDRGLAQDLRGDFTAAQADYRLATQVAPGDEVTRRLGLSQAIGGDTRAGLATLAPLVARNDAAAWRARAFVLAMDGDVAGARAIAQARMSPGVAGLFERFFARLPTLNPAERARAVHFGDMPAPGERYASATPGSGARTGAASPPPRDATNRGRGGALIPQGRALGRGQVGRRPVREALSRPSAPARQRTATRTVRSAARGGTRVAMAAPVRPTGPVPLPTPFQLTLPTPASPPPDAAPALTAPAPQPVVIASVADALRPSTPGPGSALASPIVRVDPDAALRPGDQVITPDGPPIAAASVPLAGVRTDAPESLLPPGALPAEDPTGPTAPAAAPAEPAPRPGFGAASTTAITAPATLTPAPATLTPAPAPTPTAPAEPAAARRVATAKVDRPATIPFGPPTPAPAKPVQSATATPRATKADAAKSDTAKTGTAKTGTAKTDTAGRATAKSAAATTKAKATDAKPKPAAIPERYWFQIATGSDTKALALDLARLRKVHPSIAKLDGFSAAYGKTRRLIVGPFATEAAAKTFEGKARVDGLDGYVWISPEGRDVDPLPTR